MEFPKNIIISSIENASIVKFKTGEKSDKINRLWYGIAMAMDNDGVLTYIHNGNKVELSGNKVVFFPKGSTYDIICKKAGSFAVVNFLTSNEINIQNVFTQNTSNLEEVYTNIQIILDNLQTKEIRDNYMCMSALYKILHLSSNNSATFLPPPMTKALNYIEDNIYNPLLSNTHISNVAGISEVYLRKLFTKHLATSPGQYITERRLDKAKKLLCDASLSITDIAEKCGYSDIYYFCHNFKKRTGATPTQYRNNHTKNLL